MKEKKDPVILEAFFSLSFFSFSSSITRGHDGPYQVVRIKNSIERAGTVLPNPRTDADRRVSSPRRPLGQSGVPRPGDDACA